MMKRSVALCAAPPHRRDRHSSRCVVPCMDATSTRPYAMPALLTACLVSGSHLRAIWEQVSSHDGFIHWACGAAGAQSDTSRAVTDHPVAFNALTDTYVS